ncbi:MAG: ABC transporter permease [Lachnospiraceae bacterium]|nr:ABC transporter permease [Lachnospiraceae bacterium]
MDKRVRNIVYNFIMIAVPLALLIFWEIEGRRGAINTTALPIPSEIGEVCKKLIVSGKLQKHLMVSFHRVISGFIYGSLAGVIIGILMGQFKIINKALTVFVGVLRPIPLIGWTPLFIIWFGLGEASKVVTIVVSVFWSLLINTIDGFRQIDKNYLEVSQSFGKSRLDNIFHVVIPTIFPSIFTGLRLGISNAWRGVVAAEMIAATAGIGYMISSARELFKTGELMVGLLSIGLICLFLDAVILLIQKVIFRWKE